MSDLIDKKVLIEELDTPKFRCGVICDKNIDLFIDFCNRVYRGDFDAKPEQFPQGCRSCSHMYDCAGRPCNGYERKLTQPEIEYVKSIINKWGNLNGVRNDRIWIF